MPTSFLDLPGELRNQIYSYLLLSNKLIIPKSVSWQRRIDRSLFLVNKQISQETRSWFFYYNHFDLFYYNHFDLQSQPLALLDRIGKFNASQIQSIRIPFPKLILFENELCVTTAWSSSIEKIRSRCPFLKKLTLSSDYTYHHFKLPGGREFTSEGFALLSIYFKAFNFPQEVIFQVLDDYPSAHIRNELEAQGVHWDVLEPTQWNNMEEPQHLWDLAFMASSRYPSPPFRISLDYDAMYS